MKKIYFLIILSLILLLTNVFIFVYLKNKINLINDDLQKAKEDLVYKNLEIEYDDLEKDLIMNSSFSYLAIDNLTLSNIRITKVNIDSSNSNIVKRITINQFNNVITGKKVVLKFFSYNCSTCIEKQLGLLQKYSELIGRENVVLLTDYLNNTIRDFMISNKMDFSIYETGIENTGIDFDKQGVPYLFLINEELKISMPFILNDYLKDHSETFFNNLVLRLNSSPNYLTKSLY